MGELATELQSEPSEQLTVQTIIARAVDVVPDANSASLTIRRRRRRFETLGATDEIADRADYMQYSLDEGPCVEAATNAEWVRSGAVGQDPRWPQWGPKPASLGIESLLSIVLFSNGQAIGALNMYSKESGRFADAEEIDLAMLFAVHAANALTSARLATGLEVAVGSRHMIGMAQGIVMERYSLSPDQAFNFLRRLSSTTNTRIQEVASEIVETRHVPNDSELTRTAGPERGKGIPGQSQGQSD